MPEPGSTSDQNIGRPLALIAYEKEAAERSNALWAKYETSPNGMPPAVALQEAGAVSARLFGEMLNQLTPDERAAEEARLNTALATDPVHAYYGAIQWNISVRAWASAKEQERGAAERHASELAERTLARSTYLGGLLDFPQQGDTVNLSCYIHPDSGMVWVDRRDNRVAAIPWPDVQGMRVGPTDRNPERVTVSRVALGGIFALAAKKQRREATFRVQTSTGEGIFLVRGYTPLELEAQLAPLIACVGQPTSESYESSGSASGIDPDLLKHAKEFVTRSLSA